MQKIVLLLLNVYTQVNTFVDCLTVSLAPTMDVIVL